MKDNPLGKAGPYPEHYDPALLFPIARAGQRANLQPPAPAFSGSDIWHAYEVSWLDPQGKPEVRILKLTYPCSSLNIVESKSLKLYLFSLTMTVFANEEQVLATIHQDLTALLVTPELTLQFFNAQQPLPGTAIPVSLLIDHLPITAAAYEPDPGLLKSRPGATAHTTCEHYSNLLKTNCPITRQPDWATVYIKYRAPVRLDEASLLRYIISYRNHADFHESCCERIFRDLAAFLKPDFLLVYCFYTRRGGIDINPLRFMGDSAPALTPAPHCWRQ